MVCANPVLIREAYSASHHDETSCFDVLIFQSAPSDREPSRWRFPGHHGEVVESVVVDGGYEDLTLATVRAMRMEPPGRRCPLACHSTHGNRRIRGRRWWGGSSPTRQRSHDSFSLLICRFLRLGANSSHPKGQHPLHYVNLRSDTWLRNLEMTPNAPCSFD